MTDLLTVTFFIGNFLLYQRLKKKYKQQNGIIENISFCLYLIIAFFSYMNLLFYILIIFTIPILLRNIFLIIKQNKIEIREESIHKELKQLKTCHINGYDCKNDKCNRKTVSFNSFCDMHTENTPSECKEKCIIKFSNVEKYGCDYCRIYVNQKIWNELDTLTSKWGGDLPTKIPRLIQDQKISLDNQKDECIICRDSSVNVELICGHKYCSSCVFKLGKKCSYCRKNFDRIKLL